MDTTAPLCVLCEHPASIIDTDRGNRRYVACSNSLCGDYEISRRAVKEVADRPQRKAALQAQVVHANSLGMVLEIVMNAAGEIEATSTKRG